MAKLEIKRSWGACRNKFGRPLRGVFKEFKFHCSFNRIEPVKILDERTEKGPPRAQTFGADL
jgi:hypothetical protein